VTRLFDTIVMVDWSAASRATPARPSADAIWIGVARDGVAEAPAYHRTRAAACADLAALLADEVAAGRRALAGFDFPFGYPAGFAARVGGAPEGLAVWRRFAELVEDGADNANNRFAVAARLNALFPGIGPFWNRPAALDLPDLPARDVRTGHGLPERRAVERRVPRAQPCWKLYTTGAVGSQALLGVAALERLRRDPRLAGNVAVWPLETGFAAPAAPVVFAEVYPSLLDEAVSAAPEPIKDAAQVRVLAQALARLDEAGALAALFTGPGDLAGPERDIAEREEAWILGVGHETVLRAAAAPPRLRNDCFALPAGVDWTPVDAALDRLRAAVAPVVGVETIPLESADGRILAAPARAVRAHPAGANAAVDGYAFAHASLGDGPSARLALVAGRAAAGAQLGAPVPPGGAARILTGALIPEGCDTVALQEDVAIDGGGVLLETRLNRGANVRRAGENLAVGDEAAPAGRRLGPADLAQIAAGGIGAVTVRRRLRVAVLSTGDEIAPPGAAAGPEAVCDSNRPMLLAMLRRMGFEAVDLGVAPDREDAVRAALDRGAAEADALVTSGGASAGDEDHLSRILRAKGAMTIWRIAVKPGRPLALGQWRGAPVFGLPGNPVAAFVCALLFARPALTVLAGGAWPEPAPLRLPAAFDKRKKAGRREFLRARIGADGRVETFANEGSGLIRGLVWSGGLVELPDEALTVAPGDPVLFHPYATLGL
jgi:molybdopterin molybdotransferase